jgi:hypothetical protein
MDQFSLSAHNLERGVKSHEIIGEYRWYPGRSVTCCSVIAATSFHRTRNESRSRQRRYDAIPAGRFVSVRS